MHVEEFFAHFLEELRQHPELTGYYKFLKRPGMLSFRKVYFCQRLQYILDWVRLYAQEHPDSSVAIWDCGTGYATTQIFLALHGFASTGSTLEFYYKEIPQRLDFWSKYGDMRLVQVAYQDIFEHPPAPNSLDIIIVQDTLHHLEPLAEALGIFYRALRPGGMVIAIEENGNNLIQSFKLYLRRGNKRTFTYWDENLGREVMMGNENIRPWKAWRQEFEKAGLLPEPLSLQYIRLFPPFWFYFQSEQSATQLEQRLWKAIPLLREYFFFGLNFVARKPASAK